MENWPVPENAKPALGIAAEQPPTSILDQNIGNARFAYFLVGKLACPRKRTGIDDFHRLLTEEWVGKETTLGVLRRTKKMVFANVPSAL